MSTLPRASRWTLFHLATLVGALVVLVVLCRGQWFFGDEWDFILLRGVRGAERGLAEPHNEHWSTIPILWYRAVFSLFGLKTYWPYLLGLFAVHLIAAHALWRLMVRAGVSQGLATGSAAVFALFGAGAENLTWAFQIGFVGSLATGLLLVLGVGGAGTPRRVIGVSLGSVASLALSGISVVMVGAVALAALGRWGWRRALAVGAPAALTYVVWFIAAGRSGLDGVTAELQGGPSDIPRWVWGGVSATLGAPFDNDRLGGALLVVVVLVAVARGRGWWQRAPDVLALAAASPVLFAVISQGRGAAGFAPSSSRYLYLSAAMLLPLLALAAQSLVGASSTRTAVALVGCVALVAVGVAELRSATRAERARELTLKGQLLAAMGVADAEPTLSDRPDFAYNPSEVTVAGLRSLARRGRLPQYSVTEADLAHARLALQVAITRRPIAARGEATVAFDPEARVARVGDCLAVDLRGTNALIERRGGEAVFSLRRAGAGVARLFVPHSSGNAGPRDVIVRPGEGTSVRDLVAGSLVLQLPPGTTTLCGVTTVLPGEPR